MGKKLCFLFLGFLAAAPLLLVRCGRNDQGFNHTLDTQISPSRIGETIDTLAGRPHRAGTPENRKVGDRIQATLADAGLKTWAEESETTLEEPVEQHLFLDGRELDVHERAFPQDPYTTAAAGDTPFFAYSPDADVQAQVVYANFGVREDYARLKELGIDVAGKIVLLRAQGICRGMKGVNAEEAGAAGMLLYPEPKDQGFRKPEYPEGPWLNPWTIMRGSMARFFVFPGDPLDSQNLPRPGVIPRIPSIPISGSLAAEILHAMKGTAAPEEWRGLLQTEYVVGPGPASVRLVIRGNLRRTNLRNLFALLPGSHPEEGTIVVGSHYDAWVYGAADPISGVATILECARVFARQAREGVRSRRSILFAFWDAEEYGMHGSAQWVRKNLVDGSFPLAAYINIDTAVRAHDFSSYIMPGLRAPMEDVLSQVRDPDSQLVLADIRPEYSLPGFSSDTTPFLGWSSAPVAELGFGRWYSVYHSMYDDPAWYRKFQDPGYRYTAALARILCLYLRNLSEASILPYRFNELEDYARAFLTEHKQAPQMISLEVLRFGEAARHLEEIDKRSLPEAAYSRINTTLLEATRVFSVRPAVGSFGRASVLIGPSSNEGCSADPFAGLSEAMASNDPQRLKSEAARVQDAFYRSRLLLEKAARIADGKE